VRLVRIKLFTGLIDLDDIELAIYSIPMKNTLHTRPTTPLQTPPAGLGSTYARLREPCNVDIRTIHSGKAAAIGECITLRR